MFTTVLVVEEAVEIGVVERLDAHDVEPGASPLMTNSPCWLSAKVATVIAAGRVEGGDVRAEDAGAGERHPCR